MFCRIKKLQLKTALLALFFSLLPIAISYLWIVETSKQQRRDAFHHDYQITFKNISHNLNAIDQQFNLLTEVSENCQEDTLIALRKVHFRISYIAEMGIVSPHGKLVCSSWGKLDSPIEVLKPISSQVLRHFGPLALEYTKEPAMIVAKTRPDGSEINAAIPLQVFRAFIEGNSQSGDIVALSDSNNGTPLFVSGSYSLPLALTSPLFPLRQSKTSGFALFDDGSNKYFVSEVFAALPGLTLIASRPSAELYKGVYRLSLIQLCLYCLLLCCSMFLVYRHRSQRLSQRSRLKLALKNHEFINYYQEIYDTRNKHLVAVEALVRWMHPVDGLRYPDAFLPDVDRYNLQVALTEQVISNLKNDLHSLLAKQPSLKVNINITGQHLKDASFINQVLATHAEFPNLCLEVTETELVEIASPQVQQSLQRLKQRNVKLAIDDFGTGYAGLQYLQQLPLDTLKIDRSFVVAINTDSPQAKVLDGVIDLALNLDLQIVAEGVENQQQADYLISKGVYLHQGWLYGKPQPIKQFS
ncbi:EAL domain-containing protein [Agarivorans sp. Alg241-V36]|uniref:EAL domain-containing protein n=1 Tax=Agarivorans sp. Alg241-V36 TaxID=2305992 RepID=UPI0013D6D05C|nr:EAL domain-containing protein [Agarivorans sp. Alg241-V36]